MHCFSGCGIYDTHGCQNTAPTIHEPTGSNRSGGGFGLHLQPLAAGDFGRAPQPAAHPLPRFEVRTNQPTEKHSLNIPELKSKIVAHEELTGEIPKLEAMQAQTQTELAKLSAECTLTDENSLLNVTRLQTLAGLLPVRIQSLRECQEASSRALVECTGGFVSQVLSPKIREVRATAAAKVKKAIASHFSSPEQLDNAVKESDLVTSIDNVFCVRDASPSRVATYARNIAGSWEQITKIEKTL